MGPNEQYQRFAELRQKVCLYIQMFAKLRCQTRTFLTKKEKTGQPSLDQTEYRLRKANLQMLTVSIATCRTREDSDKLMRQPI